jgi:hypothetical protein
MENCSLTNIEPAAAAAPVAFKLTTEHAINSSRSSSHSINFIEPQTITENPIYEAGANASADFVVSTAADSNYNLHDCDAKNSCALHKSGVNETVHPSIDQLCETIVTDGLDEPGDWIALDHADTHRDETLCDGPVSESYTNVDAAEHAEPLLTTWNIVSQPSDDTIVSGESHLPVGEALNKDETIILPDALERVASTIMRDFEESVNSCKEKCEKDKTEINGIESIDNSEALDKDVNEHTTAGETKAGDVSAPPKQRALPESDKERVVVTNPTLLSTAHTGTRQASRISNNTDLLGLPMDALHSISSFLTPQEWCNFVTTNKSASRIGREILQNARLHGFRCAMEVVTAWKLGQHEDAKEMAGLYISSGVPIYPRSLGHSYHTMRWRMGVEIKEMLRLENYESVISENTTPSLSNIDAFYQERQFRARDDRPVMSYLAEKSLFWMDKLYPVAATASFRNANRIQHRGRDGRSGTPTSAPSSSTSTVDPKIPLKIHQHLLDEHQNRRYSVNDLGGTLVAPPVSLSADFFHPHSYRQSFKRSLLASYHPLTILLETDLVDDASTETDEIVTALLEDQLGNIQQAGVQDDFVPPAHEDVFVFPIAAHQGHFEAQHLDLDNQEIFENVNSESKARVNAALSRVDIEVYSSAWTSSFSKIDETNGVKETKRHLRSRFTTYQRRLESLLVQRDHSGFDECILDFWDEFFPHSAGIQFYDEHTPVPRVSCLSKFLTRPCPKSIGIVQCEIERIKVKGVNMKGRLFPTYEYRLFIRNRSRTALPDIAAVDDEKSAPRRDTILMIAKNKGRKHAESSGVTPMSATARKGSNNYYLYTPQQNDVDAHYNHVNRTERAINMNPNGANYYPVLLSDDTGCCLLGRLQSNFIGTEFQIFTPHVRKRPRRRNEGGAYSANFSLSDVDDEFDYDSGVSSDTNSVRRSRFGRLSLRRSTANPAIVDSRSAFTDNIDSRGRSPTTIKEGCKLVKRATSLPELPQGRQARTNRRIANTPDAIKPKDTFLCEEEDGVITYTANLLGSRPRIMDVCLPKVSDEGVAAVEWKRYLDSCDDIDDTRMLQCFRQLQQRLENPEALLPVQDEPNQDNTSRAGHESAEDFGLLALQNRPPWWNIELGSFVLNFGGRVSVASVKNFQLCERNDQDNIMLQFGRIQGRHSFTMDFQHPLTAVQAFSIAISSLQSKISFG